MPRRPVTAWGSVSRGVHRRSIEFRNHRSRVPTLLDDGEGNMKECAKRVLIRHPGVRDLWYVHKLHEWVKEKGTRQIILDRLSVSEVVVWDVTDLN